MSPRDDSSQTRGDEQNPRSKSLIKVPATGASPQSAARLEPRALYPRSRLGTLTASFLGASRGWGAVQPQGTLRGASPGGSRHRAGTGWGGGAAHLLGAAGDFGAAEGSSPGAVLHCESSVSGRPGSRAPSAPARARRLLQLRAEPREVGEARGAGPATGARRRGRGHGGVFLVCPRLRSAPLPSPAAFVSSPLSPAGSGSRARKAPSEVRADGVSALDFP